MLWNLARYVRTKLHPLRISGMLVRLVGIVQYTGDDEKGV